jgi:putative addiction module component (TIGR02574 family)
VHDRRTVLHRALLGTGSIWQSRTRSPSTTYRIGNASVGRYDRSVSDLSRRLLEDAMTLSSEERIDLAEQLLSSVPADGEWLEELARRARRALADPGGGEAWEVVERRLAARVSVSACRRPWPSRRRG